MKNKVGQSCGVNIFLGLFFFSSLNMICRSGKKVFDYSLESLKFNIRGEV